MRDVYIVGVGQTAVTKRAESVVAIGADAVARAIEDAGGLEPTALYVGNMLGGMLCRQTQLGAAILEAMGRLGIEAAGTEAACGGGGVAARFGVMAIRSGMHEVVAVCGAECMSVRERDETVRALATASDWPREGARGETFVSLNARLMEDYLHRYGYPSDALAPFAINAHENARKNPFAMFHKALDHDGYVESKRIHGHMCLFDAAPICDGSACLLLASGPVAARVRSSGRPVVRVLASTAATDTLGLGTRADALRLAGLERCTKQAYQEAGLGPADIDVYEPHDAFTVMTALSLEASGFAEWGKGAELGAEIGPEGRIPTTTMGGLKGRGHPVGATGVYQMVEATLQLMGRARDAQLPGHPRIALTQNLGGTGATAVTHILARE